MNKKTGLEYFSFDIDFFQDEKIQFVSARFGTKGEAITVRLLCKIYRQGYYTDWNDDIALLFAKSVGDNCQHSCVKDVVYELLKRGFFDRSIFERFSILTSKGIQRRYFDASLRRKAVEYNPDFILIDMLNYSNVKPLRQNANKLAEHVNIFAQNVDILKQSTVKESKENVVVNAHAREDENPYKEVVTAIQQIKPILTETEQNRIADMVAHYPFAWIMKAIDIAVNRKEKVKSFNFVFTVLANWRNDGYGDGDKPWEPKPVYKKPKTLTQQSMEDLERACLEYDRRNAQQVNKNDICQLPQSAKY